MDDWLNELLDQWDDQRERGALMSVEELRAAHPTWFEARPELFEELTTQIRKLLSFQQLIQDPEGGTGQSLESQASIPEFENYVVERQIGVGGMGRVYLAKDAQLGLRVAIKVLEPRMQLLSADRQRMAERFVKEAQTLAALNHPNIVRVFAGKPKGERPYFAMEYLPRSLADAGEEERLRNAGPRAVVEFMIKVAKAVHYAHCQGVLHRDLKPANILIDVSGEPKVCDFGLAKLISEQEMPVELTPAEDDTVAVTNDETPEPLTNPAFQPGTPAYMAPEQHDPALAGVDARTDVWALGMIVYRLFCGGHPFASRSKRNKGSAHYQKAIQVGVLQPIAFHGLSTEMAHKLNRVIAKCLAKNANDRYLTSEALANDLEAWLTGAEMAAAPSTFWKRTRSHVRRHLTRASIGLAALTLLGVALLPFLPQDNEYSRKTAPLLKRLRQGDETQLIGAANPTPGFIWRKGDGDVAPVDDFTGTIRIAAQGPALLELLPQMPSARYKISAEISHEVAFSETSDVGVYCCYDMIETPQTVHHVFVKAAFADTGKLSTAFLRPGKGRCSMASLSMFDFVRDFRPEKQPHNLRMSRTAEFFFFARNQEKRKWRRLEITVNDIEPIMMRWDDEKPQFASRNEILGFFADLRKHDSELRELEIALRPRGSLGIYISGSSALIKTLVITPLE